MTRPLFSVVLPTHNRVDLLRHAVDTVLAQTEPAWELIVVDDASTDGTAAYLEEVSRRDARVQVVRNPHSKGGAGARNEGISHSRGEWVAFLDDDDEWMPDKLELQRRTLEANPSAIACTCAFIQLFPSGRTTVSPVPQQIALHELLESNVLGGASVCVCSTAVLKHIGGFDSRLRSGQDWDLWVRLCEKGTIVSCSAPLVVYREHSGPRISLNTGARHAGARRFYLKHRGLMGLATRRMHVANCCFIMSRHRRRTFRVRLRYLFIAMKHASPRAALSYFKRSVLGLLREIWSRSKA